MNKQSNVGACELSADPRLLPDAQAAAAYY